MPPGPLSGHLLAISHLLLFGLSPENFKNVPKMFINSITDFVSLRKKVVSSVYAVYRSVLSNMLRPFTFSLSLVNKNTVSKISISKYAEIGSPCLVPLLKQLVVVPPFTMHYS